MGLMARTCLPLSHTNRGLRPRPGLSLALPRLPQCQAVALYPRSLSVQFPRISPKSLARTFTPLPGKARALPPLNRKVHKVRAGTYR